MTDTPELNVWREASDAASENAVKWRPAAEQRAAAVIHSYGDERDAVARNEGHAEGYQAAIDDVVKWLRGPCAIGRASEFSNEITRRFGKGQDHG